MADAKSAGQCLESGVVHLIGIPDTSIGDCAHTAQGFVNVAVHLSPESAMHRWLVQALNHHNFWSGNRGHVGTVLFPTLRIRLRMLRTGGFYHYRDGISHHWSHLRHVIGDRLQIKPIPCTVL